jgi:hypothetical protein
MQFIGYSRFLFGCTSAGLPDSIVLVAINSSECDICLLLAI